MDKILLMSRLRLIVTGSLFIGSRARDTISCDSFAPQSIGASWWLAYDMKI